MWLCDEELEELENEFNSDIKTLTEISLYDIGAEDLGIWIGKDKNGFKIHLEDENGNDLMVESCIHEYAMQSMADFCKKFLEMYERIA